MSKDKQIEGMAREMCHLSAECKTCQICNERYHGDDDDLCYFQCVAKEIINHGYRKQSEGHWMVHHCTNGGKSQRGRTIIYKTFTCDSCGKSNGRRQPPFCPNCGAKMKGGAE